MNYRKDKYGNPISILGFGCMRFTQSGGKIDLDKAEREILEAIQSGVNYFDTAYVYPGSEDALGRILEKNHLRDQVSIATKLPHYLLRKPGSFEKYFSEELKRLRTDRVDYYLMHMLTDVKTWERLKSLGIVEWLREKQRSGAIRQVGFSYHGNSEMFCQLVDAYDWDFCQIQYNYMDEHSQAGRRGLQYAASKQIPVMIMDPLRGGKLVGLAGCSADCEGMWQIGVDVLPEYRKKGIASALTGRLAAEILERGKVPFYCSAWSNVRSARNAVKSGFVPAWVEMTIKPEAVVKEMNGISEKDLL